MHGSINTKVLAILVLVLSRWLAPRIGFILRRALRVHCRQSSLSSFVCSATNCSCLVAVPSDRNLPFFGTDVHAGHKQFSSRPCACGYWLALWLLALFCHIAQGGPPEVHETAASSPGSYGGMGLLSAVNVFLCFNKEVRLTVSYLLHDVTICARLVVSGHCSSLVWVSSRTCVGQHTACYLW